MRYIKRGIHISVFPLVKKEYALFKVFFYCLLIIYSLQYPSDPLLAQESIQHIEISQRLLFNDRLNITNPREGDTISGTITIEWSVDEAYVDGSTSYQVHYSPDDGSNWIIIAVYILNPFCMWNTTLYEEYNSQCRIQVTFQSKNFEDFRVVTGRFAIDNRISADPNDLVAYLLILASIIVLGVVIWKYRPIVKQKSILQVIKSEKHEWLVALSHKIIIGLDNIKSEFIEEISPVAELETVSLSASIADIFPLDIRHDLQHRMKGRTVLTLIEMAYIGPHATTPTKISKNLNIPLPTLSKEIKKLEEAGYVKTYLTSQMLKDARFKNFMITKKGFRLLSNLDIALKIAIGRNT